MCLASIFVWPFGETLISAQSRCHQKSALDRMEIISEHFAGMGRWVCASDAAFFGFRQVLTDGLLRILSDYLVVDLRGRCVLFRSLRRTGASQ